MDILAPDVSRLEIKVEWMNGETFVIFNAVRFSSPPCGEGCRSFKPKGISHWI